MGMMAIQPMLEYLDTLVQLAQSKDVFVCNFVATVKVCEAQLYSLYVDPATHFTTDDFWALKDFVHFTHNIIIVKWWEDLNDGKDYLAYIVNGDKVYAKHMPPGATVPVGVHRELFQNIAHHVENKCIGAATQLQYELEIRFLDHSLLDALGVVYFQYWRESEAELNFMKHINVLKAFYPKPKHIGEGSNTKLIPPVLDGWKLESQQGYFKTSMMSNWERVMEHPMDINPLTCLWHLLDANSLTRHLFSKYFKLAEIAMVHVLGSVEDERCFSSLSFLKDKLRNALHEHLPLVVSMYSQSIYTLESFPYDAAFDAWSKGAERKGRYGLT